MKKALKFLMIIVGTGILFNTNAAEYCRKTGTDFVMSYTAAQELVASSELTKEADAMEKHWCNEITGTWWIAARAYKNNPICHPAFVVDVAKKNVQVNWMCTGLLRANNRS